MERRKNPKIKGLLAVTLFIVCTDALFIWINYRASWQTFHADIENRRQHLLASFNMTMATTASNMQQIATYIASDDQICNLFLAGRKAVEAEGGGKGGAKAAALRNQLYHLVYNGWKMMTDTYTVRQLHFHLGPGDVSFLRVHQPDKYGDDLSPVRYTIMRANSAHIPTKGFESGRVYSGIRGVTPVYAKDPETGKEVQVGALEAGTSLALMLAQLRSATGYELAALLLRDHLQRNVWPEYLNTRLENDSIGDELVLEQATTEDFVFLRKPSITASLFTDEPYIDRENGTGKLILSFPFKDYHQQSLPHGRPVGYVVAWQNIENELVAIQQGLITNIWYGLVVFAFLELLLIFAWRYGMRGLETMVKERTTQLSETNELLEREIGERKEAEALVRRSEEEYRSFFMDNKAVMLIIDPRDGAIINCNDAACSYYQFDRPILLRFKVWDLDPSDQDKIRKWMELMMAHSGARTETLNRLATGELRNVIVSAGPIRIRGDENLFAIVQDITELKKEERARKVAERRYQEIFENAPVGIFRFSRDGRFLNLNRQTAKIYGFADEESLLRYLEDDACGLFYQREWYDRFMAELEHSGRVYELEFQGVQGDGTIIWASLIASKADAARGEDWFDCFIFDISERKKLEHLRADVERMTRHDLMGPLTYVMNLPTLVSLNGPVNEAQQKDLDNLEQTAIRMSNMINMSLNLYKMEIGAYTMHPVSLDLVMILKRAAMELHGFAVSSGVKVVISGDNGEQLNMNSIFIRGEELICVTMFENLLKNAIEASPPGESVQVRVAVEDGSTLVRIANMGAVPPNVLEHFFDKYVTSGKVGGTGLGTYLARLVVRIHNGDISVRSTATEGTEVTVRLPGGTERGQEHHDLTEYV